MWNKYISYILKLYLQYREQRWEQEKELLQNQNTWLNTELKAKTDELLVLVLEKGTEILDLKYGLENKKEEVEEINFQSINITMADRVLGL